MEKQHLFAKKTFDSCFKVEWENSTCFIQKVLIDLIDLYNQKQEYECLIYLSEVWGGLLNTPIVSVKVHISDAVMHILKSRVVGISSIISTTYMGFHAKVI